MGKPKGIVRLGGFPCDCRLPSLGSHLHPGYWETGPRVRERLGTWEGKWAQYRDSGCCFEHTSVSPQHTWGLSVSGPRCAHTYCLSSCFLPWAYWRPLWPCWGCEEDYCCRSWEALFLNAASFGVIPWILVLLHPNPSSLACSKYVAKICWPPPFCNANNFFLWRLMWYLLCIFQC